MSFVYQLTALTPVMQTDKKTVFWILRTSSFEINALLNVQSHLRPLDWHSFTHPLLTYFMNSGNITVHIIYKMHQRCPQHCSLGAPPFHKFVPSFEGLDYLPYNLVIGLHNIFSALLSVAQWLFKIRSKLSETPGTAYSGLFIPSG